MRKVTGIVVIPVGIYLFKFNSRNTRTRCEIYSNVTIQVSRRRGAFIVTLSTYIPAGMIMMIVMMSIAMMKIFIELISQ